MTKRVVLLLIVLLTVSSIILITHSSASITNSSVPEFTLRNASYPYDVPPTTTSTTDPYTGKVTTTTIPGYHVENRTIEAIIKNPPGASYYNFRYKGHFEEKWKYDPFNSDSGSGYSLGDSFRVPFQASSSSITVLSLYFFQWLSIPENGTVNVQVQALFGNFDAVPYGHIIDVGGPTYDFYFKGTTSKWSDTQTITIGENAKMNPAPSMSPSPFDSSSSTPQEPTVPQGTNNSEAANESVQTASLIVIGVGVALVLVCVGLLAYSKKRINCKVGR